MPCINLGNMAEATLRVARLVNMALLVKIGIMAALLVDLAELAVLRTRVHLVNILPDAKVVKAAREARAKRAKRAKQLAPGRSLWPIVR
jgi:hypothetical protein